MDTIIIYIILFAVFYITFKAMERSIKRRMKEIPTPRQKLLRRVGKVAAYLMLATGFCMATKTSGVTVWSICLGTLTAIVSVYAMVGYLHDNDRKQAALSTLPIAVVVLLHIMWLVM